MTAVPFHSGTEAESSLHCENVSTRMYFPPGMSASRLCSHIPSRKWGVFAREQDAGGAPCGQTQTGLRRDGLYPAKGETALDGLHGVIRCAGGYLK